MKPKSLVLASFVASVLLSATLQAQAGGTATARLRGYDEVPAIASGGGGQFDATISEDGSEITYTLSYVLINPSQSHLHFAEKGVNGGISIFLCSNLGNGPAGTPACPPAPATVTRTVHAEDVTTGASAQGIAAGNLGAMVRAIRVGIVYANIHSATYPGGEIRGQLVFTPTPPNP